jgi:hypothetical protein
MSAGLVGWGRVRIGRGECGARALVATLLLAAGVVLVDGAPASADGPTVVVTPDHVVDGELVGMDISGFFGRTGVGIVVVQCSGAVVATPQQAPSLCGLRTVLALSGPPPAHVEWTPRATQASLDGSGYIDCRTDPTGCVAGVVALTLPLDDMSVVASAFDDIVLIDALAATPSRRLADGDVVTVTVRDLEPGDRAVAQCGRAFFGDPTPASAAAQCGPQVPVTPDAGRAFTTDLTAHDPLIPAGVGAEPVPQPVACGADGCAVVLLPVDRDRPGLRAAGTFGLSFGPLRMAADPDHDLTNGTPLTVHLTGADPGPLQLHRCAAPAGPTVQDGTCAFTSSLVVDDTGTGTALLSAQSTIDTVSPPVDCRTTDCAYAVFTADGQLVAQTAPLGFGPPPVVTLAPTADLLEGAAMTLDAEHLLPSGSYTVQHCGRAFCDQEVPLVATAGGTLQATVTASQRLQLGSQFGYCRADCRVELRPFGTNETQTFPYTLAAGSLAAAPDAGLADGQTVALTGAELMPGYAGPTLWIFPTGGWSVTQCDRALVDEAGLAGALTHCAAAPVTRGVTVGGSTLDTTLAVRSTITTIVGGTVDCTAAPGACVVGLIRFDQDGTLSTHLVPVTFG